jgi:hypothetical protein
VVVEGIGGPLHHVDVVCRETWKQRSHQISLVLRVFAKGVPASLELAGRLGIDEISYKRILRRPSRGIGVEHGDGLGPRSRLGPAGLGCPGRDIATSAPMRRHGSPWLSWARRCRIPAFTELARRIAKHRPSIEATLTHGLSNALVESTNTKLRLLTRLAYGFRSTDNLIALCLLDRGGHCPALPGRRAP